MHLREDGRVTDSTDPQPELYRARARRAPKLGRFLVLGGLLGAIVAFVLVMTHQSAESETGIVQNDDLGVWIMVVFFFCIATGVALGWIVAAILDRASRSRSQLVTVERGAVEFDESDDAEKPDEPTPAG